VPKPPIDDAVHRPGPTSGFAGAGTPRWSTRVERDDIFLSDQW